MTLRARLVRWIRWTIGYVHNHAEGDPPPSPCSGCAEWRAEFLRRNNAR